MFFCFDFHLRILSNLIRSVFPLIMEMFALGTLSSFERKRISSSLARPFSGAAFRRIL